MALRGTKDESMPAAGDLGVVLDTKLAIPRSRMDLLARPEVTERLDWAIEGELVLVSAPAGFGKTTLLAQWASRARLPVVWLSLDADDDDPVRFLRYLIAAVRRVHDGFGERLATLITGPNRPAPEALAAVLMNELAMLPDETAIVLDDYHVIESRYIHGLLRHLVDHIPERMHLVISSREDPPLRLARLRGRAKLRELRVADLRFDRREVSAFFGEVWRFDLPAEVVDAIAKRTEGWVAGLQLAALALRDVPDAAAFADAFTGTHRFVLDFLSEEVLERQPEDIRRFLVDTSVLERVTAPLAETLTGLDSAKVLERLERGNLFVVPLDEHRRWYRYHQLFAEMLRARLRLEAPEREARLHRAAAAWCERHDMVDEAIRHWLAGGEAERAAELVERHIEEVLVRWVEAATMDRWLASLPNDVIRSRRRLILARGIAALAEGRLDEVQPVLDSAERAPAPEGTHEPSIGRRASVLQNVPAVMALMRADLARLRGNPEQVTAHAKEALGHVDPEEFILSVTARWQLAVGDWMSGRLRDAERALHATVAEREAGGEPYLAALAACDLGRVQQAQGRLRTAAQTFRRAERIVAGGSTLPPPAASWPLASLAAVERQRGHLDEALDAATKATDLCRYLPWAPPLAVALPALAWVHHARGDRETAQEVMEEAVRAIPSDEVTPLLNPAPTDRIRLLLAQGRLEVPMRWLDERGLGDRDDVPYPREPEYLAHGRVLIAKREPDRAIALLDRLRTRAEAEHRTASLIETRALLALALETAGEREEALAQLAGAVSLGRAEGFVAVFADEGVPMAALLQRLAVSRDSVADLSSVPPEYLARLIRASSVVADEATAPDQIIHVPDLVEPLTSREHEVLRLLAVGQANREIADALFVTLDTVKKHVSHICAKLGAANRTQAVVHARELGLIP